MDGISTDEKHQKIIPQVNLSLEAKKYELKVSLLLRESY